MLGGFGFVVFLKIALMHLVEKSVKKLTCISNNAGVDNFGLGCCYIPADKKDDEQLCG